MARVRVKWLKKHQDYGYFADAVGEVEADRATELYKKGYLIILPDGNKEAAEAAPAAEAVNLFPDDMPTRDILFAEGFRTYAQIKEAGESLKLIKGIKQKMLTAIMEYISRAEAGK